MNTDLTQTETLEKIQKFEVEHFKEPCQRRAVCFI